MVGFGFALSDILAMDVLSFDDLVSLTSDVMAEQRSARIWEAFVAAQGDKKSVKALASPSKQQDTKADAGRSRRA